MVEPMRKQARFDASAPRPSLTTLPPSATSRIVRFLVGPSAHSQTQQASTRVILQLCYVSKEWKAAALETASHRALAFIKANNSITSRSGLLEWRRTLTLRGRHVKSFEIERPHTIYEQTSGDMFWKHTFSFMPNLKHLVLDEDEFDLDDPPRRPTVEILRGAAACCPHLQKLRIDISCYSDSVEGDAPLSEIIDTLWSFKRGLRQLSMTARPKLKTMQEANDFVNNLTRSCPQLEVFQSRHRWCDDSHSWMVDLATWAKFSETCTQLRSFDFGHATYATKFFEIFGQATKPKLKYLRIPASADWDWETYLGQLSASDRMAIEASGYGHKASNPHTMLVACPNLEELIVDSRSLSTNPEVFGDVFIEALVSRCPRLTKLQMVPHRRGSIESFTDRSLHALSRLPFLEAVYLGPVRISGVGLFQLVVNHAATTTYMRRFHIDLHSVPEDTVMFYDIIEGFVQKLVDHDGGLPCERSVRLHVIGCRTPVDESWSVHYWQRINQLTKAARHKFPAVRLKCFVSGYDGASFKTIHELIFETKPLGEVERTNYMLPEIAREVEIDDVFVNRQFYRVAPGPHFEAQVEFELLPF